MKIGVLGGGQLGMMLAEAGRPLGHTFRFFDPSSAPPAARVGEHVSAAWTDTAALDRFGDGLDVITYEFENVAIEAPLRLARHVPVRPPIAALEVAADRAAEKQFLERNGVAVAPFAAVDSEEELTAAIDRIGLPAILKTRRMGYDGKGQFVLRDAAQAAEAWRAVGRVPCVLEGFVDFRRELSCISVRGADGTIAHYALNENEHRQGVLHRTLHPAANVTDALCAQAVENGRRVLEALDYVGVLTIEYFETADGLVANEIAPRVHNSGHWSIEGAETSQFENHVRAVTGMPLGSTAPRGHSAMINIIGAVPDLDAARAEEGLHLHWYGKEARPGRKLGHLTVAGETVEERERLLTMAEQYWRHFL